jgi:hypothetical protein
MKAMAAQWEQWAAKFASLTQRERTILAGAIVLGGGFLIFSFGVDPYLIKARSANQAESAARAEFVQQSAQLALLTAQNADPDAVNRNKLAQAKKDLGAVSERLARFEGGMVPPARMQAFLQGLLAKNTGIELLGLRYAAGNPGGCLSRGQVRCARPEYATFGQGRSDAGNGGVGRRGLSAWHRDPAGRQLQCPAELP